MAQITCKNLTLGYENRAIQENLNFSINAGDYLCIVGENGSGKSTLMKTLLHLQPPISGTIELGDGLHKNEIGYLPQQTLVQRDFPASVKEIVLSGCQGRCGWRPFYNKEDKEIARKAMEKMMILRTDVTGNYPEDSSRESFWQGHFVRPRRFCFWMSRCPVLIRRLQQKCIS